MGVERKKSPAREDTLPHDYYSASSSSSAFSRHTYPVPSSAGMRSSSPPASAYFSQFTGDDRTEPQPNTPDAGAHFAYSTTLRRHHVEAQTTGTNGAENFGGIGSIASLEGASGLWSRVSTAVRSAFGAGGESGNEYQRLPTQKPQQDTPSFRFVHTSIEVREYIVIGLARWSHLY